jgi:hypothetical protein
MYESGLAYARTAAENRDPFLAWERADKAFFASGACHILAHMFLSLHVGEGYELVWIKPKGSHPGNHIYASDGIWVFDFQGWTRETEVLEATRAAYSAAYPGWDCERIVLKEGLPAHIASGRHNLRPPEYFPYLPWERAYNYIKQFPAQPPAA